MTHMKVGSIRTWTFCASALTLFVFIRKWNKVEKGKKSLKKNSVKLDFVGFSLQNYYTNNCFFIILGL